jgi:hypothetical protein
MIDAFRHMLVALIVITFFGGAVQATPTLQSADAAGASAMAVDMPCDHMASMQGVMKDANGRNIPCTGLTPECVKQMGCITIPAVAERFASNVVSVSYTRVVYWSPASDAVGLSRKPDLLPPRTI